MVEIQSLKRNTSFLNNMAVCIVIQILLGVVFGWNYKNGGSDWSGLCNTGHDQSPINIVPDDTKSLEDEYTMEVYYYGKTQSRTLENDGNVILMKGDFGYIIVKDESGQDRKFLTKKVEFHYPSEHHFDGYESYMEMLIFHTVDNSDYTVDFPTYAVVSVMIRPGDPSYFFDSIEVWNLPASMLNHTLNNNTNINLLALVDAHDAYFFYKGSLNTPDCDENVLWYVFETEQWVSLQQMSYFKALWVDALEFSGGKGNVRKIRNLNSRDVYYSFGYSLAYSMLALFCFH